MRLGFARAIAGWTAICDGCLVAAVVHWVRAISQSSSRCGYSIDRAVSDVYLWDEAMVVSALISAIASHTVRRNVGRLGSFLLFLPWGFGAAAVVVVWIGRR